MTTKLIGITDDGRAATPHDRDDPRQAFTAALVNAAGEAKFTGEVRFNEQWLDQPLRWKKPKRIFVCAHGDLFHEKVPDAWIDRVFAVMALAPQHTFQVLTKRPERMREYITRACGRVADAVQPLRTDDRPVGPLPHLDGGMRWWPLPNVWLGVSAEDQATADARIPPLLATPAAVRFLSAEPLLGPMNLRRLRVAPDHHTIVDALDGYAIVDTPGRERERAALHWVIVGGESGPGARPMHPDWARSLRDQCAAAGVAFHFKQHGEFVEIDGPRCTGHHGDRFDRDGAFWLDRDGTRKDYGDPSNHLRCSVWGTWSIMKRVGKTAAGRLLDGALHDGWPR